VKIIVLFRHESTLHNRLSSGQPVKGICFASRILSRIREVRGILDVYSVGNL